MFTAGQDIARIRRITKLRVDPAQFITAITPESSYLLGLLWADGYLNRTKTGFCIRLKLVEDDGLEIAPVFAKTGHWWKNVV